MGEPTDAELDAAAELGRIARVVEPRAMSARFSATDGRVVVDLTNGCTFAFPAQLVQGLQGATETELAEVELLGDGYGLHWESRDVDISVPGLVSGLFGTKAYMARLAGQATSPAKAKASRANGAKGGRPPKAAQGSG